MACFGVWHPFLAFEGDQSSFHSRPREEPPRHHQQPPPPKPPTTQLCELCNGSGLAVTVESLVTCPVCKGRLLTIPFVDRSLYTIPE
jgi:hypothetical protein